MQIDEVRDILDCCRLSATQRAMLLDVAVALRACPHTDGRRALPYFMQAIEAGYLAREEAMGIHDVAPQIISALRDMTGWSAKRIFDMAMECEIDFWVLALAIGRTVWKTR